MSFFKKIKNNNGADLHLTIVVMILIFVFSIFLAMDFWFASSAKIILVKEIQSAEVYCLVKTVQGNYTELQRIDDPFTADMTTYQNMATERFGRQGGTMETPKNGEIYQRLRQVDYLVDYQVDEIKGMDVPIGEFGIYMRMTYKTKTLVRSPGEISNMFDGEDDEALKATANKDIKLSVSAKVIPFTWDT